MCYSSSQRELLAKRSNFLKIGGAYYSALKVEDCGTNETIYFNEASGNVAILPQFCNSHFCPICGPRIRKRTETILKKVIDSQPRKYLRFVTLTQKDFEGETLESAGRRFREAFNKITRSVWWKRRVWGYFVKFEATYNPAGDWWHYHCHLLMHSYYLPREDLKREWMRRSPGAFIVDVKKISQDSTHELSKYVSKLKFNGHYPWWELCDYMSHHRMTSTSGTIRNAWKKSDPDEAPKGYTFVGSVRVYCQNLVPIIFELSDYLICLKICNYFGRDPALAPVYSHAAFAYVADWSSEVAKTSQETAN